MPAPARAADPGLTSALTFSEAWARARDSLSAHHALFLPVAAALLFLPQLVLGRYGGQLDPGAVAGLEGDRLGLVLLMVMAAAIGQVVTQIHVSLVTLGAGGPTVGATLARSAGLAPRGLGISLLQSLAIAPAIPLLAGASMGERLGGLLLLGAGFWLVLRLIYAIPVLAATNCGVFEALKRSYELTSGKALRVAASIGLLLVGFLFLLLVVGSLTAIAAQLLDALSGGGEAEAWGLGRWMNLLVQTLLSAALSVILSVFVAILFRDAALQSRD